MSWNKSDGAKIQITFDRPIIGNASGNESHFVITVPEYDYVPNGTLHNVVKAVESTSLYGGDLFVPDMSTVVNANTTCLDGAISLEEE